VQPHPAPLPRNSGAESFDGTGSGFGGFFFAILGWGGGFQGAEETIRDGGYFLDGGQKQVLVGLGGFVEASDFSYELERGRSSLFLGDRGVEVEQGFDIPAHAYDLND
jgi:hypothetical protein